MTSVATEEKQGYLFKFDHEGKHLATMKLGEANVYHAGGLSLQHDESSQKTWLWIPLAEYRPNGTSIIYRVDTATREAEEMFRVDDHIGAIVYDSCTHNLFGLSWSSLNIYQFTLQGVLVLVGPNPSPWVALQDCANIQGTRLSLCGGVAEYPGPDGNLVLGGLQVP